MLIYGSFWPASGQPFGLVLLVLASVFIGGTPTWGGVGTVAGAIIGACTIRFMETGLIEAGLTGFYTQLCTGIVILLALLGHKLNEPRYRI
jgi:simple sugar transport system permease protein